MFSVEADLQMQRAFDADELRLVVLTGVVVELRLQAPAVDVRVALPLDA